MKTAVCGLLTLTSVSNAAEATMVNSYSEEKKVEMMDHVVSECKGRYLEALSIMHPGDEPGRALN